jgi:hypothetical protein
MFENQTIAARAQRICESHKLIRIEAAATRLRVREKEVGGYTFTYLYPSRSYDVDLGTYPLYVLNKFVREKKALCR